jgi:cation diffusion facilitator family transporter
MMHVMHRLILMRFSLLAALAAILTIGLKLLAYALTSSVGLLSDALESLVNLAGALVGLAMLHVAARPPDDEHTYGHTKAEYFASVFEGGLIMLAAVGISVAAVDRLLNPRLIAQPVAGLLATLAATVVNFSFGIVLYRAGQQHNSIVLEANAKHLFTDVLTSLAVLAGVSLVVLTGWHWLDPLVALLVALNIIRMGVHLINRSANGLLDAALPDAELAKIRQILDAYAAREGVNYHALRTRQAAARCFVSVHVLVPGGWSVLDGHRLLERIEADIRSALPNATVFTHLEPLEDATSWHDQGLEREAGVVVASEMRS